MYQNNFQSRQTEDKNQNVSSDCNASTTGVIVQNTKSTNATPPAICQCCLSMKDLRSIIKPYLYHGKLEYYTDMLTTCFSSELCPQDGSICADCVRRLRASLSFRQCVESSKAYLSSQPALPTKDDTTSKTTSGPNNMKKPSNLISSQNYIKVEPKNEPPKKHLSRSENCSKKESKYDYGDTSLEDISLIDNEPEETEISKFKSKPDSSTTDDDDDGFDYDELFNNYEDQPQTTYSKWDFDVGEQRTLPYVLDNTDRICEICHKEFSFFGDLLKHMPEHYPNHICDICGKICATRKSLLFHTKTHTNVRLHCSMCDKTFKHKSTLNSHFKVHHKGEKIYFKCSKCGELLNTYNARVKHLAEKHGREDKAYKCLQCPCRYRLGSHLRAHVRRVHLQEKNHKCPECGLSFFSRKCLEKHSLKHTGERNFACSICNKSYSRKESLRHHLKTHESEKQNYNILQPVAQQMPMDYIAEDQRYQMRAFMRM